jgi:hypothetical protein
MTRVTQIESFEDFVKRISNPKRSTKLPVKSPTIRLVKLMDSVFVAPKVRGAFTVMQPYAKLVATAYDVSQDEILRWEKCEEDTGAQLSPAEQVRQRLELEGFAVAEGEWTPDVIEQVRKAI